MGERIELLFESMKPERIATGFEFTEGPLWHPDGFLYVSDVDARVHYRVWPDSGRIEIIRTCSGGANGSTFDYRGRLVTCEQDARRVVRTEPDGAITVLAERYRGTRLNRANDIVGSRSRSLWFTDPDKKLPPEERDMGTSAIYRLDPGGGIHQAATDMNHPNGIGFDPAERRLYVSNSRPDPHLHAYDVQRDGALANSRVFAEMPYGPAGESDGVPDGLKIDEQGRIYCTGPGGIWVWTPDAARVGVVELPELPANLAFGGPDRRSMFVTARTSVYHLRTTTPGTAIPFN